MQETKSIKVKELPIYASANENALYVQCISEEQSEYRKGVSAFRQAVFEFMDKFSEQKQRAVQFYETGVAHTQASLDYIRQDTNVLPKLALITVSGFGGLLLGYRRSKFRKFLYTTALIGASTSLCYPHEAKLYSGQAYDLTRMNAKKFYNDYIMPEVPKETQKVKSFSEQISAEVKDAKDQVVQFVPTSQKDALKHIEGDKGQSSDEDADMYTTRSK